MALQVFHAQCPGCGLPGVVRHEPGQTESSCVSCRRTVELAAFPALLPKPPPMPPGPGDAPGEGDPVCFYNPARKATTVCDQCGVFVSDAWKAKWGAKALCLRCLDKLHAARKDKAFVQHRVMWDNIVLGLALLPFSLFFWWAVFLSAPAALILGLWAWKKPTSIVPRGRARMVAGLVLAALQVLGVLVFIYIIATEAFAG